MTQSLPFKSKLWRFTLIHINQESHLRKTMYPWKTFFDASSEVQKFRFVISSFQPVTAPTWDSQMYTLVQYSSVASKIVLFCEMGTQYIMVIRGITNYFYLSNRPIMFDKICKLVLQNNKAILQKCFRMSIFPFCYADRCVFYEGN